MAIYNPDSDGSISGVSVNNVSTSVVGVNRNRKFLILTNDSDENIYVACASTAVMNQGIRLSANGGSVVIDDRYTGVVTAICATGGKVLCVCEV